MVCALKRIAVEVHNVAVHDCDLMRISSLSGLDYTTMHTEVVYSITTVHLLQSAENKHGCRDTSLVQGPRSCVSSQATNCGISYSNCELSFLAVLSRMVSERTLLSFLNPTFTTPQHSSPLSLKAHCCLATWS